MDLFFLPDEDKKVNKKDFDASDVFEEANIRTSRMMDFF